MLQALRALQRCCPSTTHIPQYVAAAMCSLERAAARADPLWEQEAAGISGSSSSSRYSSSLVSGVMQFSSSSSSLWGPLQQRGFSTSDKPPAEGDAADDDEDEEEEEEWAVGAQVEDGDDDSPGLQITRATDEDMAGGVPEDLAEMWAELQQMMVEGKVLEAYERMEEFFPDIEGEEGTSLEQQVEQALAYDQEEEQRKLRREREQQLQEELARRWVRVVDHLGRGYGTGKRKTSIARVWVREGSGAVTVNRRPMDAYFSTLERRVDVLAPLLVTGKVDSFDVWATVKGGGVTGQAQALRHGIARALQAFDPELRPALRANGLVTRDPRRVERKKPGKPKARKSFQWVKR